MKDLDVRLDRLNVVVHGVSNQIVAAAMSGLDSALGRRLCDSHLADLVSLDMAELAVSPAHIPKSLDADALRGFIVEQLVEVITRQPKEGRG